MHWGNEGKNEEKKSMPWFPSYFKHTKTNHLHILSTQRQIAWSTQKDIFKWILCLNLVVRQIWSRLWIWSLSKNFGVFEGKFSVDLENWTCI